jgi:dephospho-CoA kinase
MLSTDPQPLPREIPVIGIVGGVGSGKSSVARKLAELVPAAIVNADELGHRALELPAVKAKLRQRFGPAIFDDGGNVIRKVLAKLVFGDEAATQQARADLEVITHPEIGRLAEARIADIRRAADVRWILIDAALLQEAGWQNQCDAVAFVDVAPERRWERVQSRGWSEEEWRRREASQWPVERKRGAADVVVDNNGTLEDAAQSLKELLEKSFPSSDNSHRSAGSPQP